MYLVNLRGNLYEILSFLILVGYVTCIAAREGIKATDTEFSG